ncbi:MAG: hypothetical protein LAP87_00440 [Acidobacteriia bacterium]|nr:hypothetical protein [Terriglobia bacterium]
MRGAAVISAALLLAAASSRAQIPVVPFLMGQASGTSANPASPAMDMIHIHRGSWMLMLHGTAFLTDIQQSGARGGDKFVSTSWFMFSALHPAGGGAFALRTMLSLDPATVTRRAYPLLFQTGETAFGRPLVDAQHPHDFIMELAFEYARPLGEGTLVNFYAAPVGDPALGPVAFPHRASAAELFQAPISHHWQDSTHIANEVLTAGIERGIFRLEASGFHGAEPNENRWNIDRGAVDSWSARLWISLIGRINAQVSAGRIARPEAAEPGDVVRATASVAYGSGAVSAAFVWGRNHSTHTRRDLDSYLAESVLRFARRNYLTGRLEQVDKDELALAGVFRIGAYTVGYTCDIASFRYVTTGAGANFTAYTFPAALLPVYGPHPFGFEFFLRFRLKKS